MSSPYSPVPSIEQALQPGIPMHLGRSLDTTIFRKVSLGSMVPNPGVFSNKTTNTWWTVDSGQPRKNLPKNLSFTQASKGHAKGSLKQSVMGTCEGAVSATVLQDFQRKTHDGSLHLKSY